MTVTDGLWRDRTLAAVRALPGGRAESAIAVVEQVAIGFADHFTPVDRTYDGERPRWHDAVHAALGELRGAGLVRLDDPPALTGAGVREATAAAERARAAAPARRPREEGRAPLLTPSVIAPPLRTGRERAGMGFPEGDDEPMPVMAELNLRFRGGADAAFARVDALWGRVTGGTRRPRRITEQYASGELSVREIEQLVAADAAPIAWPGRGVYRIWPDFPVSAHVDVSCVTVKADAARRTFQAHGDRIVWAVVDSGIWGDHPHFAGYDTLHHDDVADLHRVFPVDGEPTDVGALEDRTGHGTHVAGIIAGAAQPWLDRSAEHSVLVTESRHNVENPREPLRVPRTVRDLSLLAGMAPRARLVSLKVLDAGGTRDDRVGRVIRALAYVREVNGDSVDSMRIHGVNLSVGYPFDPLWFACGQSPLCKEVDKLVRSGVVVVVAAGNSGYGTLSVKFDAPDNFGMAMTINDPGNSALAITVGSTHRDAPHLYGVSYFSSKGPTGDGRMKPDLVAPGERITSCAAGSALAAVAAPDGKRAVYVEESGTSMAAPHVSGAIAAFLSVHREFVGRPDEVKKILTGAATSLGRAPAFEGAGLLDLMRAMQAT